MIIDTHIHFFRDDLAEKAARKLIETAEIPCYTDFTEADTAQKLAEWGIDLGIVLPIATKPSQQRGINDWAKTVSRPGLACFGTVHPDAEGAADELQYIKNSGLLGVKLHPDYQNFFIDDERVFPLYETAAALGLPVAIHAGFDPVSPDVTHAEPEAIARVHRLFPKMKLIAAHMGGVLRYDEVLHYLAGSDIWFDTSISPLYCPQQKFEQLLNAHGAHRVLFATDCPWGRPPEMLDMLDRANLSPSQMDQILFQNAKELLGI